MQVRRLRSQLDRALTLLPRPLPAEIEAIEVVLVDRATMAQVHADFLGDATETDVITFPYGEILVCPAVAQDVALVQEAAVHDEVLLYALHGLLHLGGYNDKSPEDAAEMALTQEALLRQVLEG